MSYTQVFGGTTIYPSDVSYLALALAANTELAWPLESNDPENPAARVIDVTTSGAYSITLPDATQTGPGQTILFNNLSASSDSFTLKDNSGATIATVAVGEQWQVYLASNTTAAGVWRVFRYGASTATVQASALAGYGLTVTTDTLSQSMPVTTFNSDQTVLATDRASALVWNGTGIGTLTLMGAPTVGNNFFIGVRNAGGGDLTVAADGSETIDGSSTLSLRPGESTLLVTDGLEWYTVGLGQEAVFAFDYTSIAVTGGNYTLSGSELNRITYKFVGVLTADQYIIVPSTVQQYWLDNATTGAYSLYVQTSGGTPIEVVQGTRGIYYCNGANMVDADTSTIPIPVTPANGGTGITSYSVGDLIYASGAATLSKLADVVTGNALISGGVGVAPSWGKIGLTTHVTGTLAVQNGGTGASTLTDNGVLFGNGTSPIGATAEGATGQILVGNTGAPPSWAALTSSAVTSINFDTTGLTPAVATQGAVTVAGTLVPAHGGTGLTSYAVGDLIYASGATTLAKLADVAAGNVLRSGGVGVAPNWGKVDLTAHVTGVLPMANGGTGVNTFSTGSVLFASGVLVAEDPLNFYWDDTNNRLGIGTNAPGYSIEVNGTGIGFTGSGGGVSSVSTTPGGIGGLGLFGRSGADIATFIDFNAPDISTTAVTYRFGRDTNTTAASRLNVYAHNGANTVRHTLSSDGDAFLAAGVGVGRVVVGNSASVAIGGSNQPLQVYAAGGAGMSLGRYSADAFGAVVSVFKSRNTTVGSNTIAANNDEIGGMMFLADNGVDTNSRVGSIIAFVDGVPSSTSTPGRLVFATTAAGAVSATNRMWLTSDGYLGIANSGPSCALDVTGGIKTSRTAVTSPATTDGNIYSGTYTPTLTNTTNISGSTANSHTMHKRVGDLVTISGQVAIQATAAGAVEMGMSLPVASNFTTSSQAGGTINAVTTGKLATGGVLADTVNDRLIIRIPNVPDATNIAYAFEFTYRVL